MAGLPPPASMAALSAANLFNVNDMVAVVTGGGSGIGLLITRALAANGAKNVYILGRRMQVLQEAAESVNSALESRANVVVPVQCDVTSQDALAEATRQVEQQSGFVNLLVCNSGIGGPYGIRAGAETSLDEFVQANLSASPDQFTQTFAVNATSVWYTTMNFLKLLDAGNKKGNLDGGQWSQVVVTSSIAGFNKQNTGGFAYGQSKAAATHIVKQLSIALPKWDIRVNAICPGLYPSEMSAPIIKQGGIGREMIPLGRAGDDQDMAGAILYLASRAGGYCNSTIIITDGGRLCMFPSTF